MSGERPFDPTQEARHTHYHGDQVRGLFVAIAILAFLTQFIGTKLPLTTAALMVIIIVLVIAAGITNPAQHWIHWVNLAISIIGVLLFGSFALSRLHEGMGLVSQNGLIAIIAVLFVIALYFTTRTIRGLTVHHVVPTEYGEY